MCQYEAHLGPVHALHRHPQLPKIFLTVGDWTTNIWTEDIRDSPILTLRFIHSSFRETINPPSLPTTEIKMSSCWPEHGVTPGPLSYLLPQLMVLFTYGIY